MIIHSYSLLSFTILEKIANLSVKVFFFHMISIFVASQKELVEYEKKTTSYQKQKLL